MPVKDTPWGAMRQARAATHTPGSQSGGEFRPPKPGFLPPAPPPFSASPLPPVLASVGVTGGSVMYDTLGNQSNPVHDSLLTPPTPPATTTTTTPPPATSPATTITSTTASETNGPSNHSDLAEKVGCLDIQTCAETLESDSATYIPPAETENHANNHSNGVEHVVTPEVVSADIQTLEGHESSEYEFYDSGEAFNKTGPGLIMRQKPMVLFSGFPKI